MDAAYEPSILRFLAVEQKQHDLLPRAAAVVMLVFGAAGITSYLGSGKSVNSAASNPSARAEAHVAPSSSSRDSAATNANAARAPSIAENRAANTLQLAPKTDSSTEAVYYCGALTKKGTACTRRVKSPGRCWQHLGQPSATGVRK